MPKFMRKEWFLRRLAKARAKTLASGCASAENAGSGGYTQGYFDCLNDVEGMLLRRGDPVDAQRYWKP